MTIHTDLVFGAGCRKTVVNIYATEFAGVSRGAQTLERVNVHIGTGRSIKAGITGTLVNVNLTLGAGVPWGQKSQQSRLGCTYNTFDVMKYIGRVDYFTISDSHDKFM